MEFEFTVDGLGVNVREDETYSIFLYDERAIASLPPLDQMRFRDIMDVFGRLSAKAQGLSGSITDLMRVRSQRHRLYVAARRKGGKTRVLGYLKTGKKKLFMTTQHGRFEEIEPTCLLDFYVHESCQRAGVGRELFEHFLAAEGELPESCAYDRPSPKLLAFVKSHYGLHEYINQSNNYVVFRQYWEHAHGTQNPRRNPTDDTYATVSMRPLTAQKNRRMRAEVEGKSLLEESRQRDGFTLRQGFFDHSAYRAGDPLQGPPPAQKPTAAALSALSAAAASSNAPSVYQAADARSRRTGQVAVDPQYANPYDRTPPASHKSRAPSVQASPLGDPGLSPLVLGMSGLTLGGRDDPSETRSVAGRSQYGGGVGQGGAAYGSRPGALAAAGASQAHGHGESEISPTGSKYSKTVALRNLMGSGAAGCLAYS